jgi:hypothetical protein
MTGGRDGSVSRHAEVVALPHPLFLGPSLLGRSAIVAEGPPVPGQPDRCRERALPGLAQTDEEMRWMTNKSSRMRPAAPPRQA